MTIRNKYLVWLVVKIMKLQPYKVNFVFEKEIYDKDITKLGFLNQVKHEFNEQVEIFRDELEVAIREEIEKPVNWEGQ